MDIAIMLLSDNVILLFLLIVLTFVSKSSAPVKRKNKKVKDDISKIKNQILA